MSWVLRPLTCMGVEEYSGLIVMDEDDGWDDARRNLMVEGGITFESGTSVKIGFWIFLGIIGLIVIASMLGLE